MAPKNLEPTFRFELINYSILDVREPSPPPEPKPPATIHSLPMEIIIHIFKYLNPSDLKFVALVSRRFLSACMYKKLSKNFVLNFVASYARKFDVKLSQFGDTFRVFPAIAINAGSFDVASQSFWFEYGANVEEIYFRSGILKKQDFENIIRWTPNLRRLEIEANSPFSNWDIRGTYDERLHNFDNCYHISLAKNNFLNKQIFDYIVSKAPHLREIDLSFCLTGLKDVERNKFMDHFIFYLKGYGENIKVINLRQTLADDFFLQQLAEVKCLKLKSLAITFNGSASNRKFGIIPLINAQKDLEELDLQESPAVEETVMQEICRVMKNLRKLNLRKCTHVTDICMAEISKLDRLEVLDLTSCDLINNEGIHDGLLCGKPKTKLRELYFGMLASISENIFERLWKNFNNQLTTIDLGGSTNLADEGLQKIFLHFPALRHLNLEGCWKISDYGVTGKSKTQCSFSIKSLRGLKTLHLQNCYKITDFALIDSFEFLELRELYLARTHFTRDGIEALVKNCPAIELLDLGEVKGVDDDVVEIITRNLSRLNTLKINGNERITDKSFDHIYNNCKNIKFLYLKNCLNLKIDRYTDQVYPLYLIKSLRKVCL